MLVHLFGIGFALLPNFVFVTPMYERSKLLFFTFSWQISLLIVLLNFSSYALTLDQLWLPPIEVNYFVLYLQSANLIKWFATS